jgi:hypothetical protein
MSADDARQCGLDPGDDDSNDPTTGRWIRRKWIGRDYSSPPARPGVFHRLWQEQYPETVEEFAQWCVRRQEQIRRVKSEGGEPDAGILGMGAVDDSWRLMKRFGIPTPSQKPLVPDPAAPARAAEDAMQFLAECAGQCEAMLRTQAAEPAADDDTAFRPAKEFLDATRFTTFKRLRAVLKRNPWVRTRKPSPQRLEIHAGDWHRYIAMLDGAGFDALDVAGETADAFLAEVRQRQADIRRRKEQEEQRRAGK